MQNYIFMRRQQRNKDFCRRCGEIYEAMQRRGISSPALAEVVSEAIATPAPGFYVDPEYAYGKVLEMLHGRRAEDPATPSGRMWMELTDMVRERLAERGGTVSRALGHVLNFRRPSAFHITHRLGCRIAAREFETRLVHRPRRGHSTEVAV